MGIQRKLVSETRSALFRSNTGNHVAPTRYVNDYIAHHRRQGDGWVRYVPCRHWHEEVTDVQVRTVRVVTAARSLYTCISRATCMRWVGLDAATTALREELRTTLSRCTLTPSRTKSMQ